MSLIDKIYEHLKTKKKYNTLQVKYESVKEDLENKITEYNILKRQYLLEKNTWEQEFINLTKKKIKGVAKNVRNTNLEGTKVSRKKSKDNK